MKSTFDLWRSIVSMAIFGVGVICISHDSILTASPSVETHIISISGITDASSTFALGRNICFIPISLANIVAGSAHCIVLTFPSSANSPRKRDVLMISVSNSISFPRIPRAIGRSYMGHFFLISAGARFTVIRLPPGNPYPLFFIALLTRSRLSWIAVSPSHTIVNCPIPVTTSTSTSTMFP